MFVFAVPFNQVIPGRLFPGLGRRLRRDLVFVMLVIALYFVVAKAIVKATTHYKDAKIIAKVSKNLGEAMPGLSAKQIPPDQLMAGRGW